MIYFTYTISKFNGGVIITLLVSWIGIDNRGPSSAYIASDSRISWKLSNSNINKFDFGKKVFAFSNYPDILGYCGDVLFPSIVLSQIIEMGDNGLLFGPSFSSKQRFEVIKEKIFHALNEYPQDHNIVQDVIQIIYISRSTNKTVYANTDFFVHTIEWHKKDNKWTFRKIELPAKSDILFCLGSGAKEFKENYARYQESANKCTSRNVFHCFCDTLFNVKDDFCGGAPQLVGIYRKPNSSAMKYGIIANRKRYLFGAEIREAQNYEQIEWRNDFFEVCDGKSMKLKQGSAKQPDTLRRKT